MLLTGLALAALAGAAIPFGAWLATHGFAPGPRTLALQHGIVAFGAGALLSAVALVLVPEGAERAHPVVVPLIFLAGGAAFAFVDRALARRGGHVAQFLAMMLDYLPEALALGAMLAGERATAILLALLIAMQNLPEGFNAFREMKAGGSGWSDRRLLGLFTAMACLGPVMAFIGMAVIEADSPLLGGIMLFSAGGILYLLFEDVAPQVPLENVWAPPFGAIAGFALGLAGHLATGA
jgi:ZIP family zinc transporter